MIRAALPFSTGRKNRLHQILRNPRGHGVIGVPEGVFRELHCLSIRLQIGGAFRAGREVLLEPPSDLVGELSIQVRPDERMTARTAALVLQARNVSLADGYGARTLLEPTTVRMIASSRA